MDERRQRIRELFDKAVELSGAARDEFLGPACGDDDALRRSVESLLRFAAFDTTHLPPMVGVRVLDTAEGPRSLPSWMVAGTRIGPHELIRKLGSGAMGVVFLARHCTLGLRAIKFLHGRGPRTPESVDRFVAEGRALAMCQHQNIVVIHDVGQHEGCPFMVLEYLEGQTLRQWMHDGATRAAAAFAQTLDPGEAVSSGSLATPAASRLVALPLGRAVEIMVDVVRALAHAHDQGIVHRDLKPENVMLTDAGVVKVLDFGIATLVSADADHPSNGSVAGTLPYMAPEQLAAERVDRRADLWAIGIMLYELVAGRHPLAPFTYASVFEVQDRDVPMPSAAEQMPGLGPLGPIIDRCLLKHADARTSSARALLADLESLLPRASRRDRAEDESPFPGLAAFQESDADRFYGRESDIVQLVAQVRRKPLVAIAGPSGTGKSSLVRAGIIPALRRSGEGWDTFTVRPGRRPLMALARVVAQLSSAAGAEPEDSGDGHQDITHRAMHRALEDRLRREPGYFGARLRAHADKRRRQVVVFIDQLEELHTLCSDERERAAFAACVDSAADDPASPVRVIATVRADFLDRVLADRWLAAPVIRGLEVLAPLARDGLRAALVEPLAQVGYRFESDELIERMVDALTASTIDGASGVGEPSARAGRAPGTHQSALPLLQFTAARLWDKRDTERRLLTRASYDEIGGIEGALATHADIVLDSLPQADVTLARAIFERLVTPQRTRAIMSVRELRELGDGADVERVLAHLTGARLVTIEASAGADDAGDGERTPGTVELVHESLIDRWPRLERWLHENQEDREFLARLRAAARQWDAGGRSDDLVWRGRPARDAHRWHAARSAAAHPAPNLALGDREAQYLRAIVRQQVRARRRARMGLAAGFMALAVFGAVVSYLAVRARQEAELAEREAARVREEALRGRNASRMAAARELRDDPTVALSVLREIEPANMPEEWAAWTRRALNDGVARHVLVHPAQAYTAVFCPQDSDLVATMASDGHVRLWHTDGSKEPNIAGTDPLSHMAVCSPNGDRFATSSNDNTARVWRTDGTGEPLVLRGHEDRILFAWFSPDGARIVTTSHDMTTRIWNLNDPRDPVVIAGHSGHVTNAQFTSDGARLLTTSIDRRLRLWNTDGTGPLAVIDTRRRLMWGMLSPDEERIASCGGEHLFSVWNADGSGQSIEVPSRGPIDFIAYSNDGEKLVSAGRDGAVRVWDTADYRQTSMFRHGANATVAQFSADGTRIVSASLDGTARIWDTRDPNRSVLFLGHRASVNSVAFDQRGARVITASDDGTARVWHSDGSGAASIVQGHPGKLGSAAFHPDGTRVVAGYDDGVARLWSLEDGQLLATLQGHTAALSSVAFSSDGQSIVTGSLDSTARVWNAEGAALVELRGHQDEVLSARFSPDGTRVVTASADGTARIWSRDGTGDPIILSGHQGLVRAAAFSPDGVRVVTASSDKTVRLWKANGSGKPEVLRGHTAEVRSVAFSPDGTRIASGGGDETVRIWRLDDADDPVVLLGHDGPVHAVAFGPHGASVASASADGTARIWRDLEPLAPDDPRLWTATDYCLPIDQRMVRLHVPEATARADYERCRQRVRAARAR